MRKFMTLAAVAFATAGLALAATPAQAAVITCPLPTSGPVVCVVDPGLRPLGGTATHLNTLGTREAYTTVHLTGTVKNLLSGVNGNLAGTVELSFRRDLAAGGQAPSALVGRFPVSAAGAFNISQKALHSGSYRVKYLGKASTSSVNGRASSRSSWVHLSVVQTSSNVVVNTWTPRSLTNFQTPRVITDPDWNTKVRVSILCVAPEHNLRVSLVSPGLTTVTHSVNPDDTDYTYTTTFAPSGGVNAPGYATAFRVQTQRDCSAQITATQQLVNVLY